MSSQDVLMEAMARVVTEGTGASAGHDWLADQYPTDHVERTPDGAAELLPQVLECSAAARDNVSD